jgi:hypothetical protein
MLIPSGSVKNVGVHSVTYEEKMENNGIIWNFLYIIGFWKWKWEHGTV